MAAHDALVHFIEGLPPDKKDRMARRLASGNVSIFTQSFPEFEQFLLQNPHEFVVLSLGNNKCYRVENLANPGEFSVIKLECFSMPQKVADLFKNNNDLQRFLAPMHLNVACIENNAYKKIQIQPFCLGGTIEKAAAAVMSPEDRIKNCITLYKDVTSFYRILENLIPPVLFPDGKPSNFTLDCNNKLHITDMKTFVEATATKLDDCPQINTSTYPLFLSKPPPPRELKKIHSRHVGMNLYTYLTQENFYPYLYNIYLPNMVFPQAIFQGEKGGFFRRIIEATFKEDQSMRPDVEEIQNALLIIELLTQLDTVMQANPNDDLRAFGVSIKAEFTTSIEDNLPLNGILTRLKYRLDNDASLRKINDLLSPLVAQNNAHYNQSLDTFLTEVRAELSGNPPESLLQVITSKLEYRRTNDEIIRQTYARLDHIKTLYNDSLYDYGDSLTDYELHYTPQPMLKTYMEDGSEAFLNAIQSELPLQGIAAEIEYFETNFDTIRNIHKILDRILREKNSSEDFRMYVDNMHVQFEKIATLKEDPLKFLNDLKTRDNAMRSMEVSLEKLTGISQKHPNGDLEEFIHRTRQEFNSRIRDNLSIDDLLTQVNERVSVLEKNAKITETKERRGDWMRLHKAVPSTESQPTPKKDSSLDQEAVRDDSKKMKEG